MLSYELADKYIGQSILIQGEYSEHEAKVLCALLKPGDTVLDVGANVGALSLPMARKVGGAGRLWAFEPQPYMASLCAKNMITNGLITAMTYCAALSDEDGYTKIPDMRGVAELGLELNSGGAMIGYEDAEKTGIPAVVVPKMRLDALQLERVDLIKMDVEGHEPEVLRGAEETIMRCRPLMWVECDRERTEELASAGLHLHGYRMRFNETPLWNLANWHGRPPEVNPWPGITSYNWLCWPREKPAPSSEIVPGQDIGG